MIRFRQEEASMATAIDVEAQGGHQYVVRLRAGEDMNESWFSITP